MSRVEEGLSREDGREERGEDWARKEFGDFLRLHREQTPPAEDPRAAAHRRVKGLRRSEVASQVGISEQWYTLLERGRAPSVSAEVLLGIARVFGLSSVQTEHLFDLAGKPTPQGILQEDSVVPAALRRFVDAQSPCPSYVIDHHWDALAWNDATQAMLRDLEAIPGRRRNILLQLFTEPEVRQRIDGWESHAKTVLAFFRRDYSRSPHDSRIREVVAELEERSREFREWWPLQEVGNQGVVRFVHAEPGGVRLEFDRLTFISAQNPNLRVVVFLPVPNTETRTHMERLVAEHRRQRAAGADREG